MVGYVVEICDDDGKKVADLDDEDGGVVEEELPTVTVDATYLFIY